MKEKRYWLRGGLTGLIIAIITYFFIRASCVGVYINTDATTGSGCPQNSIYSELILFFIIGTFLGFLYGKIKNRKSKV